RIAMKSIVLGAVAAVGFALAFAPQQASAHWEHRHVARWDPGCCRYVTVCERYWVADDPCDGHAGCGRTARYGFTRDGDYGSYAPSRGASSYAPRGSSYTYPLTGGYPGPDYARGYYGRYPR